MDHDFDVSMNSGGSMAAAMQLEKARSVATPATRYTQRQEQDAVPLDVVQHREYRGFLGQLLHLSHDPPDIQYATVAAARSRASLTTLDQWRTKRAVRYLRGVPGMMVEFRLDHWPTEVDVDVDSDWAGDVRGRRSVSGGALRLDDDD